MMAFWIATAGALFWLSGLLFALALGTAAKRGDERLTTR